MGLVVVKRRRKKRRKRRRKRKDDANPTRATSSSTRVYLHLRSVFAVKGKFDSGVQSLRTDAVLVTRKDTQTGRKQRGRQKLSEKQPRTDRPDGNKERQTETFRETTPLDNKDRRT